MATATARDLRMRKIHRRMDDSFVVLTWAGYDGRVDGVPRLRAGGGSLTGEGGAHSFDMGIENTAPMEVMA